MAESTIYRVVHRTVRVVVLDATDCALLFACVGEDGRRFWFLPGGRKKPGEVPEETARRELREETGLGENALLAELDRQRVIGTFGEVTYDSRERWFLTRVPVCDIDTSGFTPEEQESVVAHRWWPVDELAQTSDRLVPPHLAQLIRDFIDNGPPAQPLDVGP